MSGRPQRQLPASITPAHREFVVQLRKLHATSDETLAALGRKAHINPTSLSRMINGGVIPNWDLVRAFADATSATKGQRGELHRLWERAKQEWPRKSPTPDEAMLSGFREAYRIALLDRLLKQAGTPSVRVLADRTGLSRSTVHRALTGESSSGAAEVAHDLLTFLQPAMRQEWASRFALAFGETEPRTEALAKGQASSTAELRPDEMFAEFERGLRLVRNMIAHGQLKTDPLVAAQVMNLAATLELSGPDHLADGPILDGTGGS
ncbi:MULTISPECIES: helix-turn-helix domain-containing protein [unclassified Streptomyces]|uniref:helix-turn-helix domain-containing protein n=1 Tax=unclassified Streptomyces TaxID=2593676 RepID=UPI002F90D68B|nr:helix-turn-helix domain-containing protein [Streptomyces sp. NBC_00826]WTB60728.1 helix-turn-helix domain-containing protein [Streptomyces sp. NBC_00826]